MQRDLLEISDGKKYGLKDMVRLQCGECAGCHACCEDMGDSVLLDPLDIYRLEKAMELSFEELAEKYISLKTEEGIILPYMRMRKTDACCVFLGEDGRCTIHASRPGICRLFPLGRIYEEQKISYFLQKEGCVKKDRSKIKIEKWIDTEQLALNQKYLFRWYTFRKKIQTILSESDEKTARTVSGFVFHVFFNTVYDTKQDFYSQFDARMEKLTAVIGE